MITPKPFTTMPAPNPLLGWRATAYHLMTNPLTYLERLRAELGDVFALSRTGNPPLFMAGHAHTHSLLAFGADYNRQLLSNADLFHSGPILGPAYPQGRVDARRAVLHLLGTGLFGVNGAEHRRQRRLVMPAFHKQRLGAYHADMVRLTHEMLNGWRLNEKHDLMHEMNQLTLRVALQCLFGLEANAAGERAGALIQEWMRLTTAPTAVGLQVDLPGFPYHRFLNLSHDLVALFRTLIAERRASGLGHDVLSLLLAAQDDTGQPAFNDDELIGHCAVFFIAGHETSSNALAWTFFLLSQHPAAMRRLRVELDTVLNNQPPAVEQLRQLPFLDAVIKESMRLLPPVPMSARITAEATEFAGYALPKGTEIGFSHYHTHRDPRVYDNPTMFDPARWERITPTAHEYMPFSAGIRACIGMPFALMEIPLVLALTLQRYRLEFIPSTAVAAQVGITLSPGKLPMMVRPADGNYEAGVGGVRGPIRLMVNLP